MKATLRLAFLLGMSAAYGCSPSTVPAPNPSPAAPATSAPSPSAPASPATAAPAAPTVPPPTAVPPAATVQPAAVSAPDAQGAEAKKADEGKTRNLKALPEAKEARAQLVEARRLARKGDAKTALLLLDKVLDAIPTHREALWEKCQLCMKEKLYEEALFTASLALSHYPDDLGFERQMVVANLAKGNTKQALQAADSAIDKHGKVPEFRYLRAVIYAEEQDIGRALTALEDAVANGFNDVVVLEQEQRFQPYREEPRLLQILVDLRARREQALRETEEMLRQDEQKPLPDAGPPLEPSMLLEDLQRTLARPTVAPPQLDVVDVYGKPMRLTEQAGKTVLVESWGLWSSSSRQLLPVLVRLEEEMKDKGLVVWTLCYEPSMKDGQKQEVEEAVKSYMKPLSKELRCAVVDTYTAARFGVNTFPHTTIIARDGRLALSTPGVLEATTLRKLLEITMTASLPPLPAPTTPLPALPGTAPPPAPPRSPQPAPQPVPAPR